MVRMRLIQQQSQLFFEQKLDFDFSIVSLKYIIIAAIKAQIYILIGCSKSNCKYKVMNLPIGEVLAPSEQEREARIQCLLGLSDQNLIHLSALKLNKLGNQILNYGDPRLSQLSTFIRKQLRIKQLEQESTQLAQKSIKELYQRLEQIRQLKDQRLKDRQRVYRLQYKKLLLLGKRQKLWFKKLFRLNTTQLQEQIKKLIIEISPYLQLAIETSPYSQLSEAEESTPLLINQIIGKRNSSNQNKHNKID